MKNWLAALVACVALAGCATTYQSSGFTGGHQETDAPGMLVKVNFYGNGYIAADKVQKFALYRCAEVAQGRGKPHFLIYDSLLAAAFDRPSRYPRVGTVGNKPAAFAFMLVLDEPRPGSKQTQAVIDELGALVHEKEGAK